MPQEPFQVYGIMLRTLSDRVIVEVDRGPLTPAGECRWVPVINEWLQHEGVISHIVEPLGIRAAIKRNDDRPA